MDSYYGFNNIFLRMKYPAGESHIELNVPWEFIDEGEIVVEMQCTSFDDLGVLLTAEKLFRENRRKVTWFAPYFPFARQDRRTHDLAGFELAIALDMVRGVDIRIADPHSDVAGQLPHIKQDVFVELLEKRGAFTCDPLVVIPDKGATNKAMSWICRRDFIQGEKHRDPQTGSLSGFSVPDKDLEGRPCIIVDDICDGGGTFIGLAKELKKAGAGKLTLAVTHGLFTKGTAALLDHFNDVYCCSHRAGAETGPVISYQELWNTQP